MTVVGLVRIPPFLIASAVLSTMFAVPAARADDPALAPPSTAGAVVYCYDKGRDMVTRVLRSECRYEVVDEAQARAIQERRDAAKQRALGGTSPKGPAGLQLAKIGTAFYVDDAARLLTNNHVVQDCRSITVAEKGSGEIPATVLAIDEADDLALLGVKGSQHEVARFRSDDSSLPDTFVATVGFPDQGLPPLQPMVVNGTLLRGAVGMADNSIVFKAPVRHGNSGGPIFDSRGGVIGIVRARIDEVETFSMTGHVVEDTAVGVGLGTMLNFLDNNGANYRVSQDSEVPDTSQILALATTFVVRAQCYR